MRRFFAIALALGLLSGLCACRAAEPPEPTAPPAPFDPAAYGETLRGYGEDFTRSGEAMRLLNSADKLPDQSVAAFLQYLYPACGALERRYRNGETDLLVGLKEENWPIALTESEGFAPNYWYISQALLRKASPGMRNWLALMVSGEFDYGQLDCAYYLQAAKNWYDFEIDYPELAGLLAETRYSFSAQPDDEYALCAGQYARYSEIFLRGGAPPSSEDGARLWADYESVCGEFLADEANRKYPFYEAVQTDNQPV